MSIGYTNLYGSVGQPPRFSMRLGGGLPGFIPQTLQTTNNYDEFAQSRFLLKQAWNTQYPSQMNHKQPICTPFRAINNAGDLLSRQSYSCGGACQTFQSRPGMHGLGIKWGSIQNMNDGTTVPSATCNTKYVYDSSDYARYKKQDAIAKTFNNLSNGGDQSSASQSAWRHIRRY